MARSPVVAKVARIRKNMDLDAGKLARARQILGAATETETVDRALDYVLFQAEVSDALDFLADEGGLTDPFAATTPARRVAEKR